MQCSNSSWKILVGLEKLQEAEPGDVAPSLFVSRWKWSQPTKSRLPVLPDAHAPQCLSCLGAAQPNCKPSHVVGQLPSAKAQPLEDTISRAANKHQGQQQAQYMLAAPMMGWISHRCSCLFLCPSWLVSLVSPVSCSGWGCHSCMPVQHLAQHRSLKRCSAHRKINSLSNIPFMGPSVPFP